MLWSPLSLLCKKTEGEKSGPACPLMHTQSTNFVSLFIIYQGAHYVLTSQNSNKVLLLFIDTIPNGDLENFTSSCRTIRNLASDVLCKHRERTQTYRTLTSGDSTIAREGTIGTRLTVSFAILSTMIRRVISPVHTPATRSMTM